MSFYGLRSARALAGRVLAFGLAGATICGSALSAPVSALADTGSYISGIVLDATGKPVSNADIILRGQNLTLRQATTAQGRFAFPTLTAGEYTLAAEAAQSSAVQAIALTSTGAELVIHLSPLKEIGSVGVTSASTAVRHSGTDVAISSALLDRLPTGNNLTDILTQLPSAARASNGQVHINGDHNGINYYVDGVQLPANLNRVLGNEVDPQDIGFLDAIEGAYPAQYGDRFAAVLNIGTKVQNGPPGGNASVQLGSYGLIDTDLGYHEPLAKGGSISAATRFEQTNRGIDPPVAQFVHDRSSDNSQFVRVTLPAHGQDIYNIDVLHSQQTFQIPPDTGNGIPSTTDDDEIQQDTFASLQYRHAIKSHGSFSFGPSVKISHIVDTNDLLNDLAPGLVQQNAGQNNCTDFSNCPYFSVADNRIARDYRLNADYDLRSAHHEIKAGALYDTTLVSKNYNITLQPFTALNPNGLFASTDNAPNVAHQQEAYVQDTWKMGNQYIVDYGLRQDAFQIFSTNFDQGFSQTSPRFKLTRILSSKASVYAYYGRLFVPFSFENVSPSTAAALYVPSNNPGTTFDLKPQRDSLYEIGGHTVIGKGELGVRVSHKVSSDWLDDTQVGATNLHQDINFPRGLVDLTSLYFQQPLPRNGRMYASVTRSVALNSANCETQLLQNCAAAGPPGGPFAQADHDQRYDVSGGYVVNNLHGGWYSVNTEYGSGLSLGDTSSCPGGNTINCKVPPHWIFNAEKGFRLAPNTTMSLNMQNLLNDHYALTLDSSLQGTHYATPRTISVLFRFNQP